MKTLHESSLYAFLDLSYVEPENAPEAVRQLLDGGVDLLQVRAKDLDPGDIIPVAKKIHTLTRKAEVPLIINDHAEVAAAVKAEGLHLGQDDMPIGQARGLVGPKTFIGKSTHSHNQALDAGAEGADYIGYGPIFATPTKPQYQPVGLEELEWIHETIHLPVFCIGGIKLENIPTLTDNHVKRVAIVSALLNADDPAAYARDAKALLPDLE